MLSLEPQVSKNTEPDGSETEMPPRDKIQPQQARYIVPTSFVRNDIQCLLRDAPNPPNNPLYGAWIDVTSARVYNKNISRNIEEWEEKESL